MTAKPFIKVVKTLDRITNKGRGLASHAHGRIFILNCFSTGKIGIRIGLNTTCMWASDFKPSRTLKLQSTLVISKSKGPSKTVRDIRTSTYQICSIEEKTI